MAIQIPSDFRRVIVAASVGKGRVVRHLAVEAEPAEPAVSEVQVNLLAQPPFRTNAVAVANQQQAVRDQSKAGQ